MGKFFSKVNVPTMVAVIVTIVLDKKLKVSDWVASRLPF